MVEMLVIQMLGQAQSSSKAKPTAVSPSISTPIVCVMAFSTSMSSLVMCVFGSFAAAKPKGEASHPEANAEQFQR